MKNCSLCNVELKFLTSASFGVGKLIDGEVCNKCYLKTTKMPGVGSSLKKYTLAELQQAMAQGGVVKEQKADKLQEIKTKIQSLKLDNVSTFFGRKEINELPNILAADEQIDHIVQGNYNDGQGILVSTDRRLIFIDKGLLYGLKVEDFPLDKITTIQYETGLMFGKIKIHTSGNIAVIDTVDKAACRKFAEFVRDKLSKPKDQPGPVVSAGVNQQAQPDILEQLKKLGQLKDAGVLSEEEFAEQKKKLLGKL